MSPTKAELIERHEQLLKLDEVLTEHEKTAHFNMGDWTIESACGTEHCLAGWAGVTPWFNQQGFVLDGAVPLFDNVYGKSACNRFFGEDAYQEIFDSGIPSSWAKAMDRVRTRLERIKAEAA